LGDGGELRITTKSSSPDAVYVRQLTLNGQLYQRAWLPFTAIRSKRTTTLVYTLDDKPNNAWAARAQDAPPSFTAGAAPVICFIRGEDSIALQPGATITFTLGMRRLAHAALRLAATTCHRRNRNQRGRSAGHTLAT
jgi:hypothetical protein